MSGPTYQIEWLDLENAEHWDEFVLNSSRGSVFQTSTYLKLLKKVFNKNPKILLAKRGAEIAAGVTLLPAKRMGLHYSGSPFYFPYNGIVVSDFPKVKYPFRITELQSRAVRLLLKELESNFQFMEFVLPENFGDLRPFVWNHWQVIPEYSVKVNLNPKTDYLSGVESSQRRKIRALSHLEFSEEGAERLEDFWELHLNSYRLHRALPPLKKTEFISFLSALLSTRLGKIFSIGSAPTPLAMVAVVEGAGKAYAIISGRAAGKESSGAEIALLFRLFQYYESRGFTELDLLGGMHPSITKVKLELGGVLQRTDRVRYFKSFWIESLWHLQSKRIQKRRTTGAD
ncbi:MAG: hypothetical protein Kow0037_20910 [Calditrichia bacterium]